MTETLRPCGSLGDRLRARGSRLLGFAVLGLLGCGKCWVCCVGFIVYYARRTVSGGWEDCRCKAADTQVARKLSAHLSSTTSVSLGHSSGSLVAGGSEVRVVAPPANLGLAETSAWPELHEATSRGRAACTSQLLLVEMSRWVLRGKLAVFGSASPRDSTTILCCRKLDGKAQCLRKSRKQGTCKQETPTC